MGIYAVTGAASGIGKEIADRLRDEGNEIITVDIRDADIVADLSDSQKCEEVVAEIVDRAPDGLDGFVPCAGVGPEAPDPKLIPLINYFGVVTMVNGLLPSVAKKRGSILLISSNSSQMTQYDDNYMDALLNDDRATALKLTETVHGAGLYGGGKQALSRWMRRNTPDAAKLGVRMNAIAPGYTETGMTKSGMEDPTYGDAIRQFVASIPIGRPGQPEDQANAALFLLSDKASFITGAVLFVDGGHDAVFRADRF